MSMPALSSTDIPITHINMWLQGLGIFLTFCGMASAAAWGGAKLALKTYDIKIDAINSSLALILEAQRERRVTVSKIQEELQDKVPLESCAEDRGACNRIRSTSICEMGKQIANLTQAIELQNEKREKTKDEMHTVLMSILDKIANLRIDGNGR
jgi:hypothetical protein